MTVDEGDGTATFTVTLSAASGLDVTVNYATSDATATAGSDYTAASGTASIPAGSTTDTFTVAITDDAIDENTETFTATLSSPVNAMLADGTAMGTITDNDATPTVNFSASNYDADEGTGNATITVTLSALSGLDVTVSYATSDGTATAGSDYTAATGTLTITAGTTEATFVVPIANDAIDENDETVNLSLSDPTVFRLGARAITTLTILDNDPTPVLSIADVVVGEADGTATFTVTLSAPSGLDVSFNFATSDDSATAGSDYIVASGTQTITAGTTTANLQVSITDDAIDDDGENFTVSLSGAANATLGDGTATGQITDNDTAGVSVLESGGDTRVAEGGFTDNYSVVLLSEPTAPVTITVSTDAQLSANPTELIFTASNWNVLQDVVLVAVDDAVAEGAHTGTVSHSATSPDSVYNPISVTGLTADITDNDSPGVVVTESSGGTDVTEGGGSDNYSVALTTQPTANVTINISDGGQATATPAQLLFTAANWNIPQDVAVSAVDDAVAEGTHSGLITHSAVSSDPNYDGILVDSITVQITDNDSPSVIITESSGSTDVVEGGATDSYSIRLASQPTADVTITAVGGAHAGVSSTPLVFTTANWNIPQDVTVTAVDDLIAEGNHTVTVQHSAASSDTNYNGIAIATVTVHIVDNDSPGVIVTESGGSTDVTEGGLIDNYSVVLTTQPTAPVTITITGGGHAGATPGKLVFTATNWNIPQDVVVTAVDDAIAEGTHTTTIQHSATSGDSHYNGIGIASVTVHVTDNDTPAVVITESSSDTNVAEGGNTDSYTLYLTTQPAGDVTVQFTAGAQVTLDLSQMVFTAANWNIPQTVTVTAVDDAIAEGAHTATILHSAAGSDPNYGGIAVANVTVHIADNDTAGVQITESDGSTDVTEGGVTDSYAVDLASQPTGDVTVSLISGAQATVNVATLTFTPANWNVAQTVTVTAVDDAVVEGPHTATIAHSAASTDPNYAAIPVDSITVHITDDDASTLSIADVTVDEGDGTATFTVTISKVSVVDVSFDFVTSDGSALDSSDYTAAGGTRTITAGTTTTSFDVSITDDAIDENSETFTATLSSPVNATIADGTGIGTITDNDSAPTVSFSTAGFTASEGAGSATITVTLSAVSGLDMTVDYATSDGTAAAGSDYTATSGTLTIPAGQTSGTFTVPIAEDVIDENNETVNLVLSNPTVLRLGSLNVATLTITDNDPTPTLSVADVTVDESDGTATFTVTLSAVSGLDVNFDFATSDSTATAGNDYTAASGTLTITAGTTTASFGVNITDDAIDENSETFTAALSSPVNATLADGEARGTITDNDPTPALSITGVTVGEGDGTATVVVTLSAASGLIVEVDYATEDGSASAGSDYTSASGRLTIQPGETQTNFVVSILPDLLKEGSETVLLRLSNPSNATIGTPNPATLTILDSFTVLYAPLVFQNYPYAPDLVITSIAISGGTLELVIQNQGIRPVIDPFWVDVYINPTVLPRAVNQVWSDLADYGIVWGVDARALPIEPGESLTLTLYDPYFDPIVDGYQFSDLPPVFTAGTQIYAQVDSINPDTTYGAVLETHEIRGGFYNNISGPLIVESDFTPSAPGTKSNEVLGVDQSGVLPLRD